MGPTLGLCSGLLLAGKTDKINAAYTYYTLAKNSKVVNRHGKKVAKNAKAGLHACIMAFIKLRVKDI